MQWLVCRAELELYNRKGKNLRYNLLLGNLSILKNIYYIILYLNTKNTKI